MSDDLNTEIRISADPSGVETGMRRAKQSIADLAAAATTAGEQGGKSMQKIGAGGEAAARTMDGVTKNMVSSLQRQIAALESGGTATRQYQESIARLRGANLDTLKPYLDQLDAARVKAEAAAHSQAGLTSRLGALGGVADVVRGQILALGSSLTMGAMFAFVKRINDGVDALNDIKDATGSTIENISALEDTALRTGASLDLVGSVLIKFNDVLSKATPGSDMALALESIGLKAEELRRLDPAEALRQTAVALSGFADDANKARLIQGLFGKSVKDAAPFLADLAEKGALVGTVLASQADEADRFNKQLFEMQAHATNAARAIAGPLVEGINGAIKAFRDGSAAGEGFWETAWKRYQQNVYRLHGMPESQPQSAGSASGASAAPEAPVASKPAVKYDADAADAKKRKEQEAAAAAKQAAEALRRELAEQAKIMAELHGLSGGFADDWARLSRMYADGALSLDQLTQAQSELLAKQPAIKAAADAEKKVLDELAKARQLAADARHKEADGIAAWFAQQEAAAAQSLQSVSDRVAALQAEEAALTLATSLNISLAEAIERVAIERLREKQTGFAEGSEGWQAIEREIAARQKLLGLITTKAQREDEARGWADMWQSVDRTAHDVFVNVLQGGQDAFERLGNTLKATVLDVLYQMTVRKWIINIGTSVFGAGFGAAANAATGGGAGGALSALGSIGSGYSLLSGLGGAFGGGLAGGFGGLMGSLGLSATGSTLGGAMSAGSIALGSGNILGGLGTFAGALGPIALGIGLLSSAFSRKLKDQGIQGTLGGEAGFEGQQYRFYEGGLFRSDKTTYSAIDPELARVLAGGFSAVQDQVTDFAEALSLPTDRIKGFTTDIKVSFKGLDEAGIQKALQDALATGSNELAQQVLGTLTTTTREVTETLAGGMGDWGDGTMQTVTRTIEETTYAASEFARDGEQAIDTLTRLATSVTTVNDWFERLGLSLYEASLQGADAASSLAELFGGLENFSAAASSYYEAYYSEAERAAQVTREVAEGLAELGISMPASREGFRALVEAQDLSTEAGRATYAALLQLAPAFASVTASVQSAEDALEQQRRDAYSALERSAAAQKRVLQGQLQAARDVAGALESVFGVLHDNVRELYGEVESARAQQAAQASQFIAAAVATALASGYLPDSDQLSEAIAAARGGLDASNYGGDSAERDYAALVLAGQLAELEDVAGKQLTDAQRTVAELERQTEQLDETLVFWQQQIDIASGTYAGVLSVSAAIDRLSVLLGGGGGAPGGPESIGGGGEVIGPAYRDRGVVPRADYGADVALTSFDKFKAWYQGHATNANVAALQSSDYVVPDWMRVSHAPSNDDEMFGAYLFFKNNPQFAADFEQIMTTGRSSMPTDGSTLVRSDLSKMPTDAADFFAGDRNSLLSYEAMGLDPVLGYRLYKDGPEQFGLDIRRENFTEWLRTHKWTPDGIVESNNTLDTARPYDGYKLPRWDTSTGNIVDLDGGIYSPDGRRIGTAGRDLMTTVYGAAFVSSLGSDFGDASSQVGADDYYVGLKQKFDAAIASGQSAQDLADEIARSGASMADVAAAYGISVAVLEENLRNGGATNIPKFDVGTNYVPRDMLAYIHEGEAVVPKAYNPALNNGGPRDSARLEALIEKLTAEVAELKAAANATADNTGKSASVLVAVQRGNSLSQVAEPTF